MNPKAPSSKNTASDARAAARAGLNRARAGLEAAKAGFNAALAEFNHSADSDKSDVPSARDSHADEVADLTRQAEERAAFSVEDSLRVGHARPVPEADQTFIPIF